MRRLATTLSALGFVWASAVTVFLVSAAGYEGISTGSAVAAGDTGISVSLLSANGPWFVGLLVGVTLLAGLPFGLALCYPAGQRTTTWISGLLLLSFSIIAGFSVGLPYLLPALVLLASAIMTPRVQEAWHEETGS